MKYFIPFLILQWSLIAFAGPNIEDVVIDSHITTLKDRIRYLPIDTHLTKTDKIDFLKKNIENFKKINQPENTFVDEGKDIVSHFSLNIKQKIFNSIIVSRSNVSNYIEVIILKNGILQDYVKYELKDQTYPSFVHELSLEKAYYDVFIIHDAKVGVPRLILDTQSYKDYVFTDTIVHWIVFGSLLALILYNLTFALLLKSKIHFYYVCYGLVVLISNPLIMGWIGLLLSKVMMFDQRTLIGLSYIPSGFAAIFIGKFASLFMNLHLKNILIRCYDKSITIIGIIYLLFSSTVFFEEYRFHMNLYIDMSRFVPLYLNLFLVVALYLIIKERNRQAVFFFTSFSTMMAFASYWLASLYQIDNTGVFGKNALFIGTSIEMILFSLGMTDKIKQDLRKMNEELEEKVRERTSEIKVLMENVELGIFSIVHDPIKKSEIHLASFYSNYLTQIFPGIENSHNKLDYILNRLFKDNEKSLVKGMLEVSINEDSMQWMVNHHLLPGRAVINTDQDIKNIDIQWGIELQNDRVIRVILVLKDITEDLHNRGIVQDKIQQVEHLLAANTLGQSRFNRFIQSTYFEINSLIELNHADLKRRVLILLHTIKGNMRTIGFMSYSEKFHELENLVNHDEPLALVLDRAKLLLGELDSKVRSLINWDGSNIEKPIEIDTLKTWQRLALESGCFRLSKNIMASYLNSLEDLILFAVSKIENITSRLKKDTPAVHLDIQEIYLNENVEEIITGVLNHIVRNSMDHGIESRQERTQMNKNPIGTIFFHGVWHADHYILTICDDGRGLNLSKLEKMSELVNSSDEALAELVFKPGLTTKDAVNEISGRGVGMDAVRHMLSEINAQIHIEKISVDANQMMAFKWVITLPLNLICSHDITPPESRDSA